VAVVVVVIVIVVVMVVVVVVLVVMAIVVEVVVIVVTVAAASAIVFLCTIINLVLLTFLHNFSSQLQTYSSRNLYAFVFLLCNTSKVHVRDDRKICNSKHTLTPKIPQQQMMIDQQTNQHCLLHRRYLVYTYRHFMFLDTSSIARIYIVQNSMKYKTQLSNKLAQPAYFVRLIVKL
jgi:hypothetical protein